MEPRVPGSRGCERVLICYLPNIHIHVGDSYSHLSAIITAPEQDKNLGIKNLPLRRPLTSTSTRTILIEPAPLTPPATGAITYAPRPRRLVET